MHDEFSSKSVYFGTLPCCNHRAGIKICETHQHLLYQETRFVAAPVKLVIKACLLMDILFFKNSKKFRTAHWVGQLFWVGSHFFPN